MNVQLKYGIIAVIWLFYLIAVVDAYKSPKSEITADNLANREISSDNSITEQKLEDDTNNTTSSQEAVEPVIDTSFEVSDDNTSEIFRGTPSNESTETASDNYIVASVDTSSEASLETFPDFPEETSVATSTEIPTEMPSEAPIIPTSLEASVSVGHYIGDDLTAGDFTVYVTMSDGSVMTNPSGWSATPLHLNSESTTITVSYGDISSSIIVYASARPVPTTTPPKPITITSGLTFRRNEAATISINGEPGVTYSIVVYYSSGPSTADGLIPKTANANGDVSWTWHIGGRTAPGTYRVVISGNGQSIERSFTVVTN